jgi:hypothetical protein
MRDDHEQRECPLCGATMRLRETETILQIPGNPNPTVRANREWICPDCDNFEEAEDD